MPTLKTTRFIDSGKSWPLVCNAHSTPSCGFGPAILFRDVCFGAGKGVHTFHRFAKYCYGCWDVPGLILSGLVLDPRESFQCNSWSW